MEKYTSAHFAALHDKLQSMQLDTKLLHENQLAIKEKLASNSDNIKRVNDKVVESVSTVNISVESKVQAVKSDVQAVKSESERQQQSLREEIAAMKSSTQSQIASLNPHQRIDKVLLDVESKSKEISEELKGIVNSKFNEINELAAKKKNEDAELTAKTMGMLQQQVFYYSIVCLFLHTLISYLNVAD